MKNLLDFDNFLNESNVTDEALDLLYQIWTGLNDMPRQTLAEHAWHDAIENLFIKINYREYLNELDRKNSRKH